MLNLNKKVLLIVHLTSDESKGNSRLKVSSKDECCVCLYIVPHGINVNYNFYGYKTINNCQKHDIVYFFSVKISLELNYKKTKFSKACCA